MLEYVEKLTVQLMDEVAKGNPLVYKEVVAEKDEWSNIPRLVARYCLTLEKRLKSLIVYCK